MLAAVQPNMISSVYGTYASTLVLYNYEHHDCLFCNNVTSLPCLSHIVTKSFIAYLSSITLHFQSIHHAFTKVHMANINTFCKCVTTCGNHNQLCRPILETISCKSLNTFTRESVQIAKPFLCRSMNSHSSCNVKVFPASTIYECLLHILSKYATRNVWTIAAVHECHSVSSRMIMIQSHDSWQKV